jgi:pimeloyl-ACP methyl ester carboxylesterase
METLPLVELGNPKGKTLVFMSGFPDNQLSAFEGIITEFQKDYRILAMCFPDFDTAYKSPLSSPWGYSLQQVVDMMAATINRNVKKDEKVTLCIHDWGCVIGYLFENQHPTRVEKIIGCDVALLAKDTMPLKTYLIVVSYQLWFAHSFILAKLFGTAVGNISMLLFMTLGKYIGIHPTRERPPRKQSEVNSLLCYPYYHFWYNGGILLKTRFPACPFLFMYGKNKNIMFHNDKTLRKIDDRYDCRWRSFEGGHWFMKTDRNLVVAEMEEFLKT